MKLGTIFLVYRKEMLDVIRDRRTLVSMIVVPLLLMPLLIFGMTAMAAKLVQRARQESATVMLLGAENAPTLAQKIAAKEGLRIVPPAPDYARRIEDKELRAAVEFPPDFEQRVEAGEASKELVVKLYYYEGELRSTFAVRTLREALRDYRDQVVEQRLAARALSTRVLAPFETQEENVASPEKVSGARLGGLIPYMIILLSLTGAMYPAIDLTAGEKERGTIETILASPVSRGALAAGKFLTVLTASVATALLSLTSLGATLLLLPSLASVQTERTQQPLFEFVLSAKGIAAVVGMVLPLAVMFSAALLAIALLAKSYKEAQSYISPLMIVVILPAVAAILPGIELDAKLALIPILNVSLVCKEILTGTYHWNYIAIIFISSCVYAAAALGIAAAAFKRESVLFRT
jgi:sodium transport system permease protein